VLDPSPVTITLTSVIALALSVPGGFHPDRTVLGPRPAVARGGRCDNRGTGRAGVVQSRKMRTCADRSDEWSLRLTLHCEGYRRAE
jgi:hypothetical protein